jgi:hypothetical protein
LKWNFSFVVGVCNHQTQTLDLQLVLGGMTQASFTRPFSQGSRLQHRMIINMGGTFLS